MIDLRAGSRRGRGRPLRSARSALPRALPLLGALLLPSIAPACGRGEQRASDLALHAAITRLRDDTSSTTGRRREQLAAVRQLPARSDAARAAQSACAEAYERLFDALDALAAAERDARSHPQVDPPAAAGPIALLGRAEGQLAQAKEAMPACDAAAARLAVAAR